jgi:hypothetical protein
LKFIKKVLKRHIVSHEIYRERRSTALADWQSVMT